MIATNRLREVLSYDSQSGLFLWRVNARNKIRAGMLAGSMRVSGYYHVVIDQKSYALHRLAWLYHFGDWPNGVIYHINGVKTDNRISNLRDVSIAENQQNRKSAPKNTSSGLLGVSIHTATGKWRAQIKVNGTKKYLGSFDKKEDAYEAYIKEKRSRHPGNTI